MYVQTAVIVLKYWSSLKREYPLKRRFSSEQFSVKSTDIIYVEISSYFSVKLVAFNQQKNHIRNSLLFHGCENRSCVYNVHLTLNKTNHHYFTAYAPRAHYSTTKSLHQFRSRVIDFSSQGRLRENIGSIVVLKESYQIIEFSRWPVIQSAKDIHSIHMANNENAHHASRVDTRPVNRPI